MSGLTLEELKAELEAGTGDERGNRFGAIIEAAEPGRVSARLGYREGLTRLGGTIAGPVIMALADFLMYAVVLSLDARCRHAVTATFSMNFLRRPAPVDLIAEGKVLRKGKRLCFVEVAVLCDGDDALVAHATGSYALPPEARA